MYTLLGTLLPEYEWYTKLIRKQSNEKSLILVALTATAALSTSHAFAAAGTVNFVGNILDTACEVDVASQNQQVNLGNFIKVNFRTVAQKRLQKILILCLKTVQPR